MAGDPEVSFPDPILGQMSDINKDSEEAEHLVGEERRYELSLKHDCRVNHQSQAKQKMQSDK